MMRPTIACGLVCACLTAAGPPALTQVRRAFTVRAEAHAYRCVPVTVTIERPAGAEWRSATVRDTAAGDLIPCALSGAAEGEPSVDVTWLARDLPQGESRKYEVTLLNEPAAGTDGVEIGEPTDGSVAVNVDGRLFTRYVFEGAPKPYCYPVIGPTGKPVTRGYPMAKIEGESTDHPHQRSFWFTFGEVNGIDFWAETDKSGREVHREFLRRDSGQACGVLAAVNDWLAPDGSKVCEDQRELRIYNLDDARMLDSNVTIRATEGPVEFGDTKEGMFGFRVASTMRLNGGGGHILNSEGDADGATWGKAAAWCDYYGPVDGETVGIAIFDNPANLRHPTYWHVRDYGLFAANPFGLKYFINDQTGAGKYTVPAGESLTFRYRVLIHKGDAQAAGVADWFAGYAQPPAVTGDR